MENIADIKQHSKNRITRGIRCLFSLKKCRNFTEALAVKQNVGVAKQFVYISSNPLQHFCSCIQLNSYRFLVPTVLKVVYFKLYINILKKKGGSRGFLCTIIRRKPASAIMVIRFMEGKYVLTHQ